MCRNESLAPGDAMLKVMFLLGGGSSRGDHPRPKGEGLHETEDAMGVPRVDDLLQLGNWALVGREFQATPLVQPKAWRGESRACA